MSKRILGLDLGTTSIGWALVNENEDSQSEIVKIGVRVNPLSIDEKTDFEKGNPLTTNAKRTEARGSRRNLQRYKLRRQNLIQILIKTNFIKENTPLTEIGENTTHQTLALRAKAVKDEISLEDFSKVLLAINKKRGYKSNRKTSTEDEGQAIDGMSVAKELYENNKTPGEYVNDLLEKDKSYIPDFYRSDLQSEFDKIWDFQKQFHPTILTNDLYESLQGQGLQNSRKRFLAIKGVYTVENKGKRDLVKKQHYEWRSSAIIKELTIEEVAYVLCEVNNNLNKSSGYLGAISDRSKALYFEKITVGQFLYNQILENPHTSLKRQVFYRQDYLDEFEKIWEVQAEFHSELTSKLKKEIRDVIIFYQRKLKSQKGLLSYCLFESKTEEYIHPVTENLKKRTIGRKVISKSSPIFQEFKIWQNLNNLVFENEKDNTKIDVKDLDQEMRQTLFDELNIRGNLKPKLLLTLISNYQNIGSLSNWKCQYEEIQGNITNKALYNVYQSILENEGYGFDWNKKTASEIINELKVVFPEIGINPDVLDFKHDLNSYEYNHQKSQQLWHLFTLVRKVEKYLKKID